MNLQNEIITIANLVMHCPYCQPLSGCILSDLKNKTKDEIIIFLKTLNAEAIEQIFSYHAYCKYKEKSLPA